PPGADSAGDGRPDLRRRGRRRRPPAAGSPGEEHGGRAASPGGIQIEPVDPDHDNGRRPRRGLRRSSLRRRLAAREEKETGRDETGRRREGEDASGSAPRQDPGAFERPGEERQSDRGGKKKRGGRDRDAPEERARRELPGQGVGSDDPEQEHEGGGSEAGESGRRSRRARSLGELRQEPRDDRRRKQACG